MTRERIKKLVLLKSGVSKNNSQKRNTKIGPKFFYYFFQKCFGPSSTRSSEGAHQKIYHAHLTRKTLNRKTVLLKIGSFSFLERGGFAQKTGLFDEQTDLALTEVTVSPTAVFSLT
jgi:hypothetical protein